LCASYDTELRTMCECFQSPASFKQGIWCIRVSGNERKVIVHSTGRWSDE
jgi:hypothetical protein